MHICIIGINGVGKAHALSAAKFMDDMGGGTLTLVDVCQNILNSFKWQNSWGEINDVYNPLNIKLNLTLNLTKTADLYIISTPNEIHSKYLDILRDKLVLVEKPIFGAGVDLSESVMFPTLHYGIEWVHHPIIRAMRGNVEYYKICFIHGFPPEISKYKKYHYIHDLGSHVLGIAQYLGFNDIDTIREFNYFYDNCNIKSVKSSFKFGYDIDIPDDLLYVQGKRIPWLPFDSQDLFYRQIDYVINNPETPIFSYKQISNATRLLNRMI